MPFISEDIVSFRPDQANAKSFKLYWGEQINVLGHAGGRTQIEVLERSEQPVRGSVKGRLPIQEKAPLQFMMVDVRHGDDHTGRQEDIHRRWR